MLAKDHRGLSTGTELCLPSVPCFSKIKCVSVTVDLFFFFLYVATQNAGEQDQDILPISTNWLCLKSPCRPGTSPLPTVPNPHFHPQCTWSKARAAVNLAPLLS